MPAIYSPKNHEILKPIFVIRPLTPSWNNLFLSVFVSRAFHCQGIVMQQNLATRMMCFYCCLSNVHTYFHSAKESLTWNRSQWPMLYNYNLYVKFPHQSVTSPAKMPCCDADAWTSTLHSLSPFGQRSVQPLPKVVEPARPSTENNHRAQPTRESPTKCRVPRSCVAIGEHQATGGIDDKTNTKTSDHGGFILLRKRWESTCVAGLQKKKVKMGNLHPSGENRNCLKSLPKLNFFEFFNVIAVIAPGHRYHVQQVLHQQLLDIVSREWLATHAPCLQGHSLHDAILTKGQQVGSRFRVI